MEPSQSCIVFHKFNVTITIVSLPKTTNHVSRTNNGEPWETSLNCISEIPRKQPIQIFIFFVKLNSADVISFLCPSCSTRLTVPTQLAGVTGPCPYCQVLIQAPYPAAPQPPVQATPVQQPAAVPSNYYQPQYQPPPKQAPDYYAPPRTQPQYQYREPQQPLGQPTILRPAPRQLPDRTEQIETPTRIRRDPSGDIRQRGEPAGRRSGHAGYWGKPTRSTFPSNRQRNRRTQSARRVSGNEITRRAASTS